MRGSPSTSATTSIWSKACSRRARDVFDISSMRKSVRGASFSRRRLTARPRHSRLSAHDGRHCGAEGSPRRSAGLPHCRRESGARATAAAWRCYIPLPPGCLLAHGGAGRQQQAGRGHAAGPHPCGHALLRGAPRCRRPQKSQAGDASKTDPDDPPERPPEEAQREAQQHGSEQQRAQSQQFPCGRGLLTIGSTDPPRDGHRLNHRNPSRCSPELPSPTTGTGPASSVTPGPGRGRGRRWLEWSGARSRRRAG